MADSAHSDHGESPDAASRAVGRIDRRTVHDIERRINMRQMSDSVDSASFARLYDAARQSDRMNIERAYAAISAQQESRLWRMKSFILAHLPGRVSRLVLADWFERNVRRSKVTLALFLVLTALVAANLLVAVVFLVRVAN
ncbi:hypothetical protein AB0M02_06825 [Actinoplanes sp. NPDC051861]|uniref:hypothetical protein n=1 Tax=Actinoplanes sp. NPDC051861 TaxID=3155170 RepID=UPI00343E8749